MLSFGAFAPARFAVRLFLNPKLFQPQLNSVASPQLFAGRLAFVWTQRYVFCSAADALVEVVSSSESDIYRIT